MVQLILTILIYLIMVIPVGIYVYHIAAGKHTFADPVFDHVDNVIYKVSGIKKDKGMNWKTYAIALLATNGVMILLGYIILRIQSIPLFNPNGIGNMEESLSFNTIISFMTNTNLQHYSGESGLSYLSQMLVITFMMFVSAASGYAACIAFIRGLAGKTKDNVGNFFVDLVRITTRVLIPFSIVGGLLPSRPYIQAVKLLRVLKVVASANSPFSACWAFLRSLTILPKVMTQAPGRIIME